MTANEVPSGFSCSGVSNCYVFKSRLQEYAQKYKLPTPIYETVKEGPSHKSIFQSTVIVDGVRYDSLPGFFNRKAAEQSAAEVALQELAKSSELSQCVSLPVHEMGLCKNLLQEYAQKMNYAIPLYQCQKSETPPGRAPQFTCTVEIGGIKYTGAATKTKREAEISAGRTALIAIQSESKIDLANHSTHLTVLPCEKKTVEVASPQAKETIKTPKARRAQFKRKAKKGKRKVAAKELEDSTIIPPPPQPTEHCQNDQAEIVVEKTLNLEQPSLFMNGFKEEAEAFASVVETEASQA
ncbi:Double-stranded RNA-binding protein 1 [Raphanus sativus]|uniref:Double-stranded RNA-binding protein 1 n=1 Tax=Raphanus sativus TaxID=3726 RepID=A0A6J0LJ24_RAPSA|nr:double-stranded RNA-binding protein 1 [Raphanus sativus]KAJ4879080.1 Double-stranded RNA-binding protein 1 [Raphanus sativus]